MKLSPHTQIRLERFDDLLSDKDDMTLKKLQEVLRVGSFPKLTD